MSKQLCIKQFSLVQVQFQCQKTVTIQKIQFSINIDFLYTAKCQNSYVLNNSV